jgi:hypothetical protein
MDSSGDLQQRALAGAIGPDQADDLTGRKLEAGAWKSPKRLLMPENERTEVLTIQDFKLPAPRPEHRGADKEIYL